MTHQLTPEQQQVLNHLSPHYWSTAKQIHRSMLAARGLNPNDADGGKVQQQIRKLIRLGLVEQDPDRPLYWGEESKKYRRIK